MTEEIRLETDTILKLSEIFNFLFRNTHKVITGIFPYQVSIKENKNEKLNYSSYTYNTYGIPYTVYKLIPELLNMGVISVRVQDHIQLIDLYLNEVRSRLSREESAEMVPENVEDYEKTIGV